MARGNEIIVSANPKGTFYEGIIDDTSKPGTIMEMVPSSGMAGGRHHWRAAAPGTDGKKVLKCVLLNDYLQGKTITDAYSSGTRCLLYAPIAGEEMNILVGEVAGTGNSYAVGDRLIIDAEDGLLVPDAGTPQDVVARSMEAVSQVAGSYLLWVMVI